MKSNHIRHLILCTAAAALLTPASRAGHELEPATGKEMKEAKMEIECEKPRGSLTIGAQFSEHLTGIYGDVITPLWSPADCNGLLFLNSRYQWEDNHQYIRSLGLGYRALLPDHNVILGLNAYWDSLHGSGGSDFHQLGLGAEVLTQWVDFRFNYYLPENDQVQIKRWTDRHGDDARTHTIVSERREAALEGFNAEIGVLLPICKYTEWRLYGGYYHYENPFGGDFDGFKARLEGRLLPGVIADVEYWDDTALMGGHWTAGVRVSVPFSIFNLFSGRNPFEGASESFTPRSREFRERLSDMVERSHRVQTVVSGDRVISDRFKNHGIGGASIGPDGLPLE